MKKTPDLDIDVGDRKKLLELLDNPIMASVYDKRKNDLVRHPVGVYFQNIPIDPYVGLAAYPYDIAESFGFVKIDIIQSSILRRLTRDKVEKYKWMIQDDENYPWEVFLNPSLYNGREQLFHLGSWKELVDAYPPSSTEDVAILVALIRPGNNDLIGKPIEDIRNNIWKPRGDDESYVFKKSHAFGYGKMIMLHALVLNETNKHELTDFFE